MPVTEVKSLLREAMKMEWCRPSSPLRAGWVSGVVLRPRMGRGSGLLAAVGTMISLI